VELGGELMKEVKKLIVQHYLDTGKERLKQVNSLISSSSEAGEKVSKKMIRI
jgi:hypothetical protein